MGQLSEFSELPLPKFVRVCSFCIVDWLLCITVRFIGLNYLTCIFPNGLFCLMTFSLVGLFPWYTISFQHDAHGSFGLVLTICVWTDLILLSISCSEENG